MSNAIRIGYITKRNELFIIRQCDCGKDAILTTMAHGEAWVGCDGCGRATNLEKNDNNPLVAIKKVVRIWNYQEGGFRC